MFNCPHNSAPKLIGLKKLPQLIGATSKEPTTMIKVGINNAKCNQRTTLTKHSYQWLISFLHSLPLSCFGFSSLSSSLFFYFLIVGREGIQELSGKQRKNRMFFFKWNQTLYKNTYLAGKLDIPANFNRKLKLWETLCEIRYLM